MTIEVEVVRIHPWRPGDHGPAILQRIQDADVLIYDDTVPPELLLWSQPHARWFRYHPYRRKRLLEQLRSLRPACIRFITASARPFGERSIAGLKLHYASLSGFTIPGGDAFIFQDLSAAPVGAGRQLLTLSMNDRPIFSLMRGDQFRRIRSTASLAPEEVAVSYARDHDWVTLENGPWTTVPAAASLVLLHPKSRASLTPGYRGYRPRVILTRPWPDAWTQAESLWVHDIDAVPFPVIDFVPDRPAPHEILHSPEKVDWIVFTSPRGVDFFFHWLDANQWSPERFSRVRWAVIGPATGRRLRAWGIRRYAMPSGLFQAEGLVEMFRAHDLREKRVLIPRARGRAVLIESLRAMGARVWEWSIYRTVPMRHARLRPFRSLLKRANAVVFTSPSTYDYFSKILQRFIRDDGERERFWRRIAVIVIGPITAEAVVSGGHRVAHRAGEATAEALTRSIMEYVRKNF